ncbi:carbohydrate ABC transporter permease [Cellulomonas sp. DKR-3]|uniref:Carbohydrate ABC transporter permease n=2 Tax=Cellulomonas fulva TaxID=2835530 RepID=A0ABS5TV19_9CELL|nr:carbohydrate ABC transporter permease [Cellulomonas fulva]
MCLLLALGTVLYLGPFVIQVANSFKTDAQAIQDPVSLVPNPFSLEGWRAALGMDPAFPVNLPRWLTNSVVVAVSVTLGRVVIDCLAGYALARLRFPGKGAATALIIGVMAVPGVVLLIPKFLVIKQLGMYDSYAGMIIPLLCDSVGILLMRTAFMSVPWELEEAALIDGAGVLRRFTAITMPLVVPALITVVILSFQGSWNEFTHFLVATSDPDLATLNLGIAQLSAGAAKGPSLFPMKLALATLSMIPVALLFIFFQRYFVRSIGTTGIK